METFKLRCFWAAFYGLLWIIFGRNVSLAILVMHVIVIPLAFRSSKRVRGRFLYLPYARPFLDHDRPEKFGLEGARNVNVKFGSSVDKCSIELGVWHTLPKSLVKKHRYLLSNGSKDEINNVIDEELRNTQFPVFLYLHGVLGTRALPQRVETCKFLQNLDAHVVSFDYRGFADSTNVTPIKIGMVEDSLAVYAWIRGLVGARQPVFVWGHSIGSGIAQRAFSKLEPYSHSLLNLKEPLPPPQGMVVEGGYSSNIDLTKEYVVAKLATWLPPLEKMLMGVMSSSEVRILPAAYAALLRKVPVLILHSKDDGLATWLPPLEKMLMGVMSSSEVRILPAAYAALLRKVPVLILHSKDDGVIPYHFAEKLYARHCEVRKEDDSPATFITFEDHGHFKIYKDPKLPGIVEAFITKHR